MVHSQNYALQIPLIQGLVTLINPDRTYIDALRLLFHQFKPCLSTHKLYYPLVKIWCLFVSADGYDAIMLVEKRILCVTIPNS